MSSNRSYKRRLDKEIQNVCKHFKVVEEIQKHLPTSRATSSVHFNTERSDRELCNSSIQTLDIEDISPAHFIDDVEQEQKYYTSSESENDNEEGSTDNSVEFNTLFLAKWAVQHHVTHLAISDLLKGLKSHACFRNFPIDARTLLRTPTHTVTRVVEPGLYSHFGLQNKLLRLVEEGQIPNRGSLRLQFNIDGLPLHKSSRIETWPILCYIYGTELSPIVIGFYVGAGKPKSVSCFLSDFVSELKIIQLNGIESHPGLKILVQGYICDAPARAFLTCVKSHTGYYACTKCKVQGSYVRNRVVYLDLDSPLRTDHQFRNEKEQNEEHHTGISPLEDLEMDLVQDVPFEHLVCLGVVRKILLLWMRGQGKVYKLSSSQVDSISNNLISFVPSIPSEFCRRPRSLREIDRWKATELRQFLLYTGPLAIKKVVSPDHYQLFLCLHVAIRLLIGSESYLSHNDYAEELLKCVVRNFSTCFGEETVSYNVHGLLHLAKDAKRFGLLESFSAFRFENKLGYIKRLVRKSSSQLQQVHRRLAEEDNILSSQSKIKKQSGYICSKDHSNGPIPSGFSGVQYKEVKLANFLVSLKSGNRSVLLHDGSVFVVKNILKKSETSEVELYGHTLKYKDFIKFLRDSVQVI